MQGVMAWQSDAQVLPLFTLCFFVWLCPHASFAGNVTCWWSHITLDNLNVSIECHAEPQSFLQTCGRCNLSLVTAEKTTQATLHRCSRSTANFFASLAPQSMQSLNCELSCPEQTAGNCMIKKGYPPPTCLIPLDDEDIHCHWTRSHYPPNPTTFTLYWEVVTDGKDHGQREAGKNSSTIIERIEYPTHDVMNVWVSAVSALGSVQSDTTTFNTANIMEPLPPEITHHAFGPLEIFWNMDTEAGDDKGSSQLWQCEVQYRNEYDLDWIEALGTYDPSFVLHNPEPFTEYEFRVRCGLIHEDFENNIMSNWSFYTAKTPPAAPVGKLDVWSDCEPDSDDPSCTILWKEMPKVQARSQISSYLVRVKLNNGSELDSAEGTAAGLCTECRKLVEREVNNVSHCPSCLSCHQEQKRCCFPYSQLRVPIRDVKDICVTASSMEGASVPAYVALPRLGRMIPEVLLRVRGKSNSLDVSWSVPQAFIEGIQEYVVDHRAAGLPHKMCPNWVKVDKTQNCTTLKGQFWNYTAYNVSLFAVINNCSYFLKSTVAYTVQGVPREVTLLLVTDVSPYSANLTWEPIPLSKRRGIVLKYLLGLDNHTVWHVSSDKNSTHLPELKPGQQYEVWICAVTVAGEGERTTIRFTTATTGSSVTVLVLLPLLFIILIILTVCLIWYCSQSPMTEWLKIPDPINSSLLKQKNNQIQPSWLVSHCLSEHTLMISEVEVILISDSPFDPELPQVEEQQTQPEEEQEPEEDGGKQECGGLVRINSMSHQRTKDYRKVIDSSEDEAIDGEDEEWDEPTFPSDYEKHFMPSVPDM